MPDFSVGRWLDVGLRPPYVHPSPDVDTTGLAIILRPDVCIFFTKRPDANWSTDQSWLRPGRGGRKVDVGLRPPNVQQKNRALVRMTLMSRSELHLKQHGS